MAFQNTERGGNMSNESLGDRIKRLGGEVDNREIPVNTKPEFTSKLVGESQDFTAEFGSKAEFFEKRKEK